MFEEEVEAGNSEEEEQGVGAAILGEADVVGHEGEGEGTREGDTRGE